MATATVGSHTQVKAGSGTFYGATVTTNPASSANFRIHDCDTVEGCNLMNQVWPPTSFSSNTFTHGLMVLHPLATPGQGSITVKFA